MTKVIMYVRRPTCLICCQPTRFGSKIPINACCLAHHAHILAQDALAHIDYFLKPQIGPCIHNKDWKCMAILATMWHVQHQVSST